MSEPALELIAPGGGATIQDQGRRGWARFGVPASGAMDDHAAFWANRLLGNPAEAPMLELALQGARFRVLADVGLAIAGAAGPAENLSWRAFRAATGTEIEFAHRRHGVWTYLAVEGGIESTAILGSASAYPRGRLGRVLHPGDVLCRGSAARFTLPAGVASRVAPWEERRCYDAPPVLRVWPGPQWDLFSADSQHALFEAEWTITPLCDRVGYRLAGPRLCAEPVQIVSEPVRVGSIQVTDNGQPIVTMRDGPTVGGYPKIGMLNPPDLAWLAQGEPGCRIRFTPAANPLKRR